MHKDSTTPMHKGGRTFTQNNNSALQYHHTAKTQVNYYTTYINSHPDYKFAGIYANEGISGTNTKKARAV
jgi:site-specific DNA recombinase